MKKKRIFDKVVQWRITIEGLDIYGKPLIFNRGGITKEGLDCGLATIQDSEITYHFKELWARIIEKSKEEENERRSNTNNKR